MSETPIDRLMMLGEKAARADDFDYAGIGLTEEHVPQLAEIMLDETLNDLDSSDPRVFAPVHAVRALGQLRDERAIAPLIRAIEMNEDSDWMWESLSEALAAIGPSTLGALEAHLLEHGGEFMTVLTAVEAVEFIGTRYPDARDRAVAALTKVLEQAPKNDKGVNGSVIASLLDLDAKESLQVIERAYKTKNVDLMVTGDYEDVLYEFGLGPKPPRKDYRTAEMKRLAKALGIVSDFDDEEEIPDNPTSLLSSLGIMPPLRSSKGMKAKKAKRKQAQKAQKRNRKK